jgi:hypothetical protein
MGNKANDDYQGGRSPVRIPAWGYCCAGGFSMDYGCRLHRRHSRGRANWKRSMRHHQRRLWKHVPSSDEY